MNLQFLLEIAGLAAIFFFIILSLYGIAAFAKARKLLSGIEKKVNSSDLDLNDLKQKAETAFDNANKLSGRLEDSLDSIEDLKTNLNQRLPQLDELLKNTNELIVSSKETSDTYNRLGNDINQKVDNVIRPVQQVVDTAYKGVYKPVSDGSRFINALYRGISIFTDKLSGK